MMRDRPPSAALRKDRRRYGRLENVQFAISSQDRAHGDHRDEFRAFRAVRAGRSKATGFPIAKIAAKLAVGYLLKEIRTTSPAPRPGSASSRPSIT